MAKNEKNTAKKNVFATLGAQKLKKNKQEDDETQPTTTAQS